MISNSTGGPPTEDPFSRIRGMSVNNAMTRNPIMVRASDKLREAWLALMEAEISGAPVLDDSGAAVGILSVTDINRAILERVTKARSLRELKGQALDPIEEDREEVRELSLAVRALADVTVSCLVPKDQKLLSLSPGDSLQRAIKMMAENDINRLPVLSDGKVEGIITRQDIIWLIAGRPRKD